MVQPVTDRLLAEMACRDEVEALKVKKTQQHRWQRRVSSFVMTCTMRRMRRLPIVFIALAMACGKSAETQRSEPAGSGTGGSGAGGPSTAPAIDAAAAAPIDAPSADAAVAAIDPAVPEPVPQVPAGTTTVEIVAFEGIKLDKLPTLARGWMGWIDQHFTKCEMEGTTEVVTTTVTVAFEGEEIVFKLPKVPAPLAECIEKNIRTPYLGYDPMPPNSVGTKTLRVKLKIGPKAVPPPPDNSPVKHFGSKVKGARDKKQLNTWLDANVVRKLKPCIESSSQVVDLWKIGFEILADGSMGNVTAPSDPNVATCVTKVLDGTKAPKASGSSTVELVFAISK